LNAVVRVLGVNGSIRRGGTVDHALLLGLAALEGEGVQCETFEIGSLPLMDGRDGDYPASVAAWRAACAAANGYLIVVANYHGGMPGVLKNALDFLTSEEAGGKPFALIGMSRGDAEPGVTDTARTLRHIGGIAGVPDVVISRSDQHWGQNRAPANPAVALALGKVAADLAALCRLHEEGKLPQP